MWAQRRVGLTGESSWETEMPRPPLEAVRRLVGHTIAEVECELIVETLIDQDGNRTNSARILGISLRTLRNKIHEYRKWGKVLPGPREPTELDAIAQRDRPLKTQTRTNAS